MTMAYTIYKVLYKQVKTVKKDKYNSVQGQKH